MTQHALYAPWDSGERIKVIVGHYGSGKTEIALNMALAAREKGLETALCDLDVVNPFFRSAEQWEMLEKAGVQGIFPPYALSGVDVPVLPPEVRSVFGKPALMTVMDVGGDDAGAAALGQYAPWFAKEKYDMFMVVNPYRPFSDTAEKIIDMKQRIERRSQLRVTQVLCNANLGSMTQAEDIVSAREIVFEAASRMGVPVAAVCAEKKLCALLPVQNMPVFPIERHLVPEWLEDA